MQNTAHASVEFSLRSRIDARLWQALRARIAQFLRWQFLDGALQGTDASEAFFVRCDERTTSADDRAAGIVSCEGGVALLRAADFIVFRVAQRTLPT